MAMRTYAELEENLKAGDEEIIIHYGRYRFQVIKQVSNFELECKNVTQ